MGMRWGKQRGRKERAGGELGGDHSLIMRTMTTLHYGEHEPQRDKALHGDKVY